MSRFSLIVAFALCVGSTASAAGPRIENIIPGLGQRGTTFDVRCEGSGFTEGAGLLFYQPGVTCSDVNVESETVLVATLNAAGDCPLGSHAFRVQSKQGLSELRVVRVLPLPLVTETEPNNSPSEAQSMKAGSTAVAVLQSGDTDCYRLSLKKGERLSAEIEAVRLAGPLCDLKLQVNGPDGKPLTSADDTPLGKQDPYLTVIVPTDGDYVLTVESSGIDGSDNTTYALHLGSFPRPEAVYPPGGRLGQPVTVEMLGDSTAQWKETVTFQQAGTHPIFATRDGQVAPTPIPFRVSMFDNVLEVEPNDLTSKVSTTTAHLPVAFNGILSQPGDKDLFRFRAEAGTTIEFAAFAEQVGSRADTLVSVLALDGTVLTFGDDHVGLDSGLTWPCPATGEYLLQLTEKRRAGGPGYVYRVEARTVDPAAVAFLPRRDRRSQAGQAISIPQGNRVLGFMAVRRQRWNGEAEIDFPKLPDGVAAERSRISNDEYMMPVVFEAGPDAPIGAGLVPVTVRSYGQVPTIVGEFEQTIDLVASTKDRLYQGVNVNRLAMAVVEPAPYRIRLEQPPTALPRDGSLELIVHVERDNGFDGTIDVTIPFLPTWVDGPDKITITSDQTTGKFALRTHPDVTIGSWPTVAEGVPGVGPRPSPEDRAAAATGQAARRPRRRGPRGSNAGHAVASQLLPLTITESPVTGEIGPLLATPGRTIDVKIQLTGTGEVPKAMTASLQGLPVRVEADAVTLSAKDRELNFKVRLAQDAPLGEFPGLLCELTGEWDGHKVTYRVGRGGSLKIVKPSELVVDESGRPLSPLEILRKQPFGAVDQAADASSR